MLRAVVLTQYRRVTDGRTDGIAVASTALAMRRAVKISLLIGNSSTEEAGLDHHAKSLILQISDFLQCATMLALQALY